MGEVGRVICEWCSTEDETVTDRGPCMRAHCGACFWTCDGCLADMTDDLQGELF